MRWIKYELNKSPAVNSVISLLTDNKKCSFKWESKISTNAFQWNDLLLRLEDLDNNVFEFYLESKVADIIRSNLHLMDT